MRTEDQAFAVVGGVGNENRLSTDSSEPSRRALMGEGEELEDEGGGCEIALCVREGRGRAMRRR